jgi:hypothetical protein
MEIGDVGKSFVWKATATGTNRYEMPYSPVLGQTLAVFVDGEDVSDAVEVEEHSGVLTFDTVPAAGDVISAQGTFYRFFTEHELSQIVDASVRQHLYNRTDSYGRALTVDNLPVVEEHPASLLGSINALYTLATDASFDINIQTPDGVSIPRADRYRQLMDSIRARREQYDMLCEALNIGLTRVDVFTLRRISRTTNRYVPVYRPMEVDDRSQPIRIYLPIPTYGGTVFPTASAIYDLVFTQGDTFSAVLDFPFSLANKTAKAQIRSFTGADQILAEIDIDVANAEEGKLQISLTKEQTAKLPRRSVWDLQLSDDNDASITKTYITGDVFVNRQVTKDQPPMSSVNWSPTGWENPYG